MSSNPDAYELMKPADGGAELDLYAELFDLEGLAQGQYGLEQLLEQAARFVVTAIPAADGAGITLLDQNRSQRPIEMFAASNHVVTQIERIQYETVHEGPCITAMRERRNVRSGSLGGEKQWPRFGPRVSRLGIHSTLAVPLMLPRRVIGAINIYARAKDAFNDEAVALSTQFAQPVAVAVHNAQLLSRALGASGKLRQAFESQRVIGQAIGLLMARRGYANDEAFNQLRAISQRDHRKLSLVAADLIEEHSRRTLRGRSPETGGLAARSVEPPR